MKTYDEPLDVLALAAAELLEPEELEPVEQALAAQPGLAAAVEDAWEALGECDDLPALPAKGWARLSAALDARAAAPAPEPSPDAPRIVIALACVYCHDGLERRQARYCASCLAPHHGECFAAHGHCAAPGCSEVQVVRAGADPAPAPRPQRWRRLGLAGAGLLVLGGAVAAFRGPGDSVPQRPSAAPSESTLAEGAGVAREQLAEPWDEWDDDPWDEWDDDPRGDPRAGFREGHLRKELERLQELEAGSPLSATERELRRHLLRGQLLYSAGRYAGARDSFSRVIELDEASFAGYLWRGRAQRLLGNFGEALADLREAVDLDPTLPAAHYAEGVLNLERRRYEEAAKNFETARRRGGGEFPAARFGESRARELMLRYDAAELGYSAVAEDLNVASERRAQAWTALGDLLRLRADPALCWLDAEQRLRDEGASADGVPRPTRAVLLGARARTRTERLERAEEAYAEALELDPSQLAVRLGRARLRLMVGDLEGAGFDLRQALAISNAEAGASRAVHRDWSADLSEDEGVDVVRPRSRGAEVNGLLGLLALRQGELEAAERSFERARELDPRSPLATLGLARVAHARGSRGQALKRFSRGRELVASDGYAAHFLDEGLDLSDSARRAKRAEFYRSAHEALGRVAARNPLDGVAVFERARLSAWWGDFELALELCREAVARDPLLGPAHETEGYLLARDLPAATGGGAPARDPAGARAAFDRAIAAAESGARSRHALYGRALASLALAEAEGADPGLLASARRDLEGAVEDLPQTLERVDPAEARLWEHYFERLIELLREQGAGELASEREAQLSELRTRLQEACRRTFELAETARKRLNYGEAIEHLDRALAFVPEDADLYFQRGTCYLKIGNFVPGILDMAKALELNPRVVDQTYAKVYQLTYVLDLQRVITELDKIVSDHPDEAHVVFLRGFFYLGKVEFKEYTESDLLKGIDDFNRCLDMNPRHVAATLYRGLLQLKLANPDYGKTPEEIELHYREALDDFHAGLALDPQSPLSHYLQAQLWAKRMQEAVAPEEVEARKGRALVELEAAFEAGFGNLDRLRNEPDFEVLRGTPEYERLLEGR